MIGQNRWVALGLTLLTTTVGMMGFAAVFPLLSLWIQDFGISRAQGGLLSGLWYLPGILISLPAGWIFDRYPIRRGLTACWVLIAAGTAIMAVAPSYWVLCAGRLLFSVGMNAHMIGAPKYLALWFAGRRELGFVMGIYTMAFTAGVYLSLNLLGSIGGAQGWRPAVQLLAAVSAAAAFLVPLMSNPKAVLTDSAPATPTRFDPFSLGRGAWFLAIAYFGYSIGTEAVMTFGPDALVEWGYELAVASAIIGSYALVSLVLKPILASRLQGSNAAGFVVAATAFGLAAMALFFVPGLPPRLAAGALGISLALGMPAFFALPGFLYPQEKVGQVYGLYQMLYSIGFFAQPLVGLAVDRTGQYGAGFLIMAVYCALGLLVLTVRKSPAPPTAPA